MDGASIAAAHRAPTGVGASRPRGRGVPSTRSARRHHRPSRGGVAARARASGGDGGGGGDGGDGASVPRGGANDGPVDVARAIARAQLIARAQQLASLKSAAGGVVVAAACATCLLLAPASPGEGARSSSSSSISSLVPAAFADTEEDASTSTPSTASTSAGVSQIFEKIAASEANAKNGYTATELANASLVNEVWTTVDENFLPARNANGFDRDAWAALKERSDASPPKTKGEAYDRIRTLLSALDDPYSRFVDPTDFAPLLKYDISGVGVNVAEDAEDPTKIRVLGLVLDSSAARAGIERGDEIVAVDGESVRGKSAFQAVSMIQASSSNDVKVVVKSNGGEDGQSGAFPEGEEREVTLRRASSATNPVTARMESGDVGYIRLKEFNALAEPKVAEAVNELRGKGATSFVLDLRDNPGGLVQAGVEIARLFLPPDVNVAYTEGRVVAGGVKGDTDVDATATAAARAKARAQARGGSGGTTKETRVGLFASVDGSAAKKGGVNATTNATTNAVTPETKLKSIPASTSPGSGGAAIVSEPLAVLVNGRSASASEILTGALKDNCRATVAGSRTYGKGLIQSVYELSDGSGLVLTVGKYVTPSLEDLDRVGIAPNFGMFPGFAKANETLSHCEVPTRR